MTTKKKVYIVRHGETDACGKEDVKEKDIWMNEKGRLQIEKVLSKLPRTIDKILTSPTLRTMETAQKIQEYSLFAPIETEIRLHNKAENDDVFEKNIQSLLSDLRDDPEQEIVLVTHGRIVKMIFAILSTGKLDRAIMDMIDLSYGGITILQYGWFCTLLDG